jgi:hypothetical protein
MAQQTTHGQRTESYRDLVRVFLIIGAVIVLMLVATAILGVGRSGPLYENVPDPAGLALPF